MINDKDNMLKFFLLYYKEWAWSFLYLGKSSMRDAFLQIPTVLPSGGDKKLFWRRQCIFQKKIFKQHLCNFWYSQKSCISSSPLPIMLTANLITLRGAMEKQFHIVWCWDCQSTVQHNLISLIQIYFDFLRIIFYQAHQALLSRSIRIAMQKANMWERQEKKLVSTQRQWITEYLFFFSYL